MIVSVSEAAELLQVDEKTVLSWIRKEGLPSTRINDQYRVNRVDLLEWATNHGVPVSPEIFSAVEGDERPFPSLRQALEAGGIHYDVPGGDKLSVLKNVVGLLRLPHRIDPDFLLQILLAREALGTTAIGDGIAIPHVRNPILLQMATPAITLCFLATSIDFMAIDDKPVHILFTLTTPTVKSHLHLLARLAFMLRDERFKNVLDRRGTREEIFAVIDTIEGELPGK
jgi:PTS system nitrogen regulatory IIA component